MAQDRTSARDNGESDRSRRLRGDAVSFAIALAAIVLFVASAGLVLPDLARAGTSKPSGYDLILSNALLLNIALILLGWNRYKALTTELAAQRISEQAARQLAECDDLTGCLNRRSFAARMEASLLQRQTTGQPLAAIAIDLDNFKQVNDLNGHAAGDRVLREVSERISALLPEGSYIARPGGDEFLCAIPFHPNAPERLDHLVTKMVESVARPVFDKDNAIDISVSVGIATSAQLEDDCIEAPAQTLIHKADIAMYHAKKQGKNRYYWFEASMENELRFRNGLEIGIRRGIHNGEFVPYYEQQIDLDTGEIVGFEMLARWESPEMGLVGPDIFIPIAEEIGIIAEMSENLIVQAFADAKKWDPLITLSVNISPVQMRDPWFAQKILKLMIEHRFPASRLEIEITESCLHDNVGMVRSMITSLRNQGVRVSLDDFGTGYASLSQLRSLPFDRLKIDRSFVGELKNQGHNERLVDAIVSMSNGLKIPITAEGIEDADVLATLKQWGSMKGQGYHYGRPEPAAKVLERLAASGRLVEERGDGPSELAEVATGNSTSSEADGGVRAG